MRLFASPFACVGHHVVVPYRVLFVFCQLFLAVFAAAVRRYGMEGMFVCRFGASLVAAWGLCGLCPFGIHCAIRLVF